MDVKEEEERRKNYQNIRRTDNRCKGRRRKEKNYQNIRRKDNRCKGRRR